MVHANPGADLQAKLLDAQRNCVRATDLLPVPFLRGKE
jgi:hypothetical protein